MSFLQSFFRNLDRVGRRGRACVVEAIHSIQGATPTPRTEPIQSEVGTGWNRKKKIVHQHLVVAQQTTPNGRSDRWAFCLLATSGNSILPLPLHNRYLFGCQLYNVQKKERSRTTVTAPPVPHTVLHFHKEGSPSKIFKQYLPFDTAASLLAYLLSGKYHHLQIIKGDAAFCCAVDMD